MTNWRPLEDMETLRREIDRAFEEFGLRTDPFSRVAFLPGREPRQYPLINLSEDKENLYVEALAPGAESSSLSLTVVRNNLTISGEKQNSRKDVEPEAFHRSERAAGKFIRSIELPIEVDEGNVRAAYKNGLLVITLPKAERAKPRQISVQVG